MIDKLSMITCKWGKQPEAGGKESIEDIVGQSGWQVERHGTFEGELAMESTNGWYDDDFHVLVVDKLLQPFAETGKVIATSNIKHKSLQHSAVRSDQSLPVEEKTRVYHHCGRHNASFAKILGWFLFYWISEFPILHAPKLLPLLYLLQNCFCFCSTTFPSHVGTFLDYNGNINGEPYATNMGKWGIPEMNYKNVAQQC